MPLSNKTKGTDREIIIPELPQVFMPDPWPFGYLWSKFQLSRASLAKVSKIVLLCYQPIECANFSAQPPSPINMPIFGQNFGSLGLP